MNDSGDTTDNYHVDQWVDQHLHIGAVVTSQGEGALNVLRDIRIVSIAYSLNLDDG
jgi:hypothetical protein